MEGGGRERRRRGGGRGGGRDSNFKRRAGVEAVSASATNKATSAVLGNLQLPQFLFLACLCLYSGLWLG